MVRRLLAAAFAAGLFAAVAAADDTMLKVKQGDPFPDIALPAAQVEKIPGKKTGDTVKISDLKGKNVVVFFYPKALTKGCTIESCGFRDQASKFPKDTVLIGASADTMDLQQKFIDEHKLPYALLADTDGKLISALGIKSNAKNNIPKRITFVVGKDGKIAKIYDKVDVNKHPEDVLKYIDALK